MQQFNTIDSTVRWYEANHPDAKPAEVMEAVGFNIRAEGDPVPPEFEIGYKAANEGAPANPPGFGARIAKFLETKGALSAEWKSFYRLQPEEITTEEMAARIEAMRGRVIMEVFDADIVESVNEDLPDASETVKAIEIERRQTEVREAFGIHKFGARPRIGFVEAVKREFGSSEKIREKFPVFGAMMTVQKLGDILDLSVHVDKNPDDQDALLQLKILIEPFEEEAIRGFTIGGRAGGAHGCQPD